MLGRRRAAAVVTPPSISTTSTSTSISPSATIRRTSPRITTKSPSASTTTSTSSGGRASARIQQQMQKPHKKPQPQQQQQQQQQQRKKKKKLHMSYNDDEEENNSKKDDDDNDDDDKEEEEEEDRASLASDSDRNSSSSSSSGESEDEDYNTTSKVSTRTPSTSLPRKQGKGRTVKYIDNKRTSSALVKRSRMTKIVATSEEPMSLYVILCDKSVAFDDIIDECLEKLADDYDASLCDMINLFLRSAGCAVYIDKSMLDDDIGHTLATIATRFDSDFKEISSSTDKRTASGDAWRLRNEPILHNHYRCNLRKFMLRFIKKGHRLLGISSSHASDGREDVIQSLVKWAIAMSSSSLRLFRQSGTFVGLTLGTGLMNSQLDMRKMLDIQQQQLDAEKSKSKGKRSERIINQSTESSNIIHNNIMRLDALITEVDNGIFLHRYRDVSPEIRVWCITELGVWIKTLSSSFLNNNYLKFFGWILSDSKDSVRKACIEALTTLYKRVDFHPQLQHFTLRFKKRLLQMALSDISLDVARLSLHLFTYIVRMDDIMSPDDIVSLEDAGFLENRALREAGGGFIVERIFREDSEAFLTMRQQMKHHKSISATGVQLKMLSQLFLENEHHDYADTLVAAILPHRSDILTNWPAVIALLAIDDETAFASAEETALLDITRATLEITLHHLNDHEQAPVKELTPSQRKELEKSKEVATAQWAKVLPGLLTKFSTDKQKLVKLLKIASMLSSSHISVQHLDSYLASMLDTVHDIASCSVEQEVVELCAEVFDHYLVDNSLAATVAAKFSRLVDSLIVSFRTALHRISNDSFNEPEADRSDNDRSIDSIEPLSECDIHTVRLSIMRVASVASRCAELATRLPEQTLLQLLRMNAEIEDDGVIDVVYYAGTAALIAFVHRVRSTATAPTPALSVTLLKSAYSLCDAFTSRLHSSMPFKLRELAFNSVLTLGHLSFAIDSEQPLRLPDTTVLGVRDFAEAVLLNGLLPPSQNIGDDDDDDDLEERDSIRAHVAQSQRLRVLSATLLGVQRYILPPSLLTHHLVQSYMTCTTSEKDLWRAFFANLRPITAANCKKMKKNANAVANATDSNNKAEEGDLWLLKCVMWHGIYNFFVEQLDQEEPNLKAVQDLARGFSQSFGIKARSTFHRTFVVKLLLSAVECGLTAYIDSNEDEEEESSYVLKHLAMLEIAKEFAPRLHAQDAAVVLERLEHTGEKYQPDEDVEDWSCYFTLRNSLRQICGASSAPTPSSVRRRGRTDYEENGGVSEEISVKRRKKTASKRSPLSSTKKSTRNRNTPTTPTPSRALSSRASAAKAVKKMVFEDAISSSSSEDEPGNQNENQMDTDFDSNEDADVAPVQRRKSNRRR